MAPTDHDRPRSDGPFAPDEALFGWSPKRSAVVVLVVALGLLVSAWSHHHDYRLAPHESGATLERGVFAPWGWDEWVPEGGESAWIPVPWSLGDDAPPLEGELGDLADVFADLLTEQAEVLGDPEAVSESSLGSRRSTGTKNVAQAPAAARAKDIVLAHQEARPSQLLPSEPPKRPDVRRSSPPRPPRRRSVVGRASRPIAPSAGPC